MSNSGNDRQTMTVWAVLVEWRGVIDTEATRVFATERAAQEWCDRIDINPDEDSKQIVPYEVELPPNVVALPVRQATPEAAAVAAKISSCQCTSDGRHLCAMCGQRIPETIPVEPDADGQVRPMGARMEQDHG